MKTRLIQQLTKLIGDMPITRETYDYAVSQYFLLLEEVDRIKQECEERKMFLSACRKFWPPYNKMRKLSKAARILDELVNHYDPKTFIEKVATLTEEGCPPLDKPSATLPVEVQLAEVV